MLGRQQCPSEQRLRGQCRFCPCSIRRRSMSDCWSRLHRAQLGGLPTSYVVRTSRSSVAQTIPIQITAAISRMSSTRVTRVFSLGHRPQPGITLDQTDFLSTTTDDLNVAFGAGVFHRERGNAGKKMTLDFISRADGTTNTLLLSENLDTEIYSGSVGSTGWSSSFSRNIAFMVALGRGSGSSNNIDTIVASTDGVGGTGTAGPLGLTDGLNSFSFTSSNSARRTDRCRINSTVAPALPGQIHPRPSSLHPGTVNVMFCDAHGKTLSQNIDDQVYVSLVSSAGGRYGQPILGSDAF